MQNQEKPKTKAASPLDDVHTAPYADYAARILDGIAGGENDENPLWAILNKDNDQVGQAELSSQQETEKMIEDLKGQFIYPVKEKLQRILDSLEVVYSDKEEDYTIIIKGDGSGVFQIYSEQFQNPDLLYIPEKLRCNSIVITDCQVKIMSPIPPGVRALTVSKCKQLCELPKLPEGLATLDCFGNEQLTDLPDLPDSLSILRCASNPIGKLPKLPDHLTEIAYGSPALTEHPHLIDLTDLRVVTMRWTSKLDCLPKIPDTVQSLYAWSCSIAQPIELPDQLEGLEFGEVDFGSGVLSKLPSGLSDFTITNCKNITTLPSLPRNLISLNCSRQLLLSLPELPSSLVVLDCQGCGLTTLPTLPNSLGPFYYSGNNFGQKTKTMLLKRNVIF